MNHRRKFQRGGKKHYNNRNNQSGGGFQNRGQNGSADNSNRERSDSRDNRDRNDNHRDRGNNRQFVQSVLPSPEILQEYEYASEGTVARIVEMAEVEQDRRNAWEDEYLRFHKKSLRLGQLFGFILLLSVVWGTVSLAENGHEDVAIALAASGFGSVAAASLFSEIGRRLSRRPRR